MASRKMYNYCSLETLRMRPYGIQIYSTYIYLIVIRYIIMCVAKTLADYVDNEINIFVSFFVYNINIILL